MNFDNENKSYNRYNNDGEQRPRRPRVGGYNREGGERPYRSSSYNNRGGYGERPQRPRFNAEDGEQRTYRPRTNNYHTEAGFIEVNNPEKKSVIKKELRPNFGWLEIPASDGLIGADIYVNNIKEGKDRRFPDLSIEEIYSYDIDSKPEEFSYAPC